MEQILNDININFQGRPVHVFYGNHKGRMWVQVGMERPDIDNPELLELGKGGKAYLSEHATEDEIVKKVLGLALAYVEHETREGFYYKGKRLFGPHITLDAMMSICDQTEGRKKQLI